MSSATAQHALATAWPRLLLHRVDPPRNMSRFWSARLQPSLFEEVLLVRNWGRIGSRGQERSYWFSTRQAALAAFNKITAAKCRRGYATDEDGRTSSRRPSDTPVEAKPLRDTRRPAQPNAQSKPMLSLRFVSRLAVYGLG